MILEIIVVILSINLFVITIMTITTKLRVELLKEQFTAIRKEQVTLRETIQSLNEQKETHLHVKKDNCGEGCGCH